MATNNNDARKKQKKTVTVAFDDDGDGDDSLSLLTPVVVFIALSLGNILKEFPDFLLCLLPYVGDRMIWNSIASSNKDMHEKSKAIQPPWPLCYKLPSDGNRWSWSPCGTRIACSVYKRNIIVIVDQRSGPLRNNGHINTGGRYITNIKFSPDGSFLVSTDSDGFVKLWDTTRNCEQLQEWNMRNEVVTCLLNNVVDVCVSTCSKYIAVSMRNGVFLKDVEDGGKTISFIASNENSFHIDGIKFSFNDRAIFICCRDVMGVAIKVWHPYLNDDDEDRLITLWRPTDSGRGFQSVTFSNDHTMVAIHDHYRDKGTLWSIEMEHKCLTHKSDYLTDITVFCFTADNKYIICNTKNGPKFWSIAETEFTDHTIHGFSSGNNTNFDVRVENVSPNNRQLIVEDSRSLNHYITSYSI